MMMYIVVPGLIVVVILVVVLVALGMRANRADSDDWVADDQPSQPRGRRAAPPPGGDAFEDVYDDHGTGYDRDRRVAGGPPAASSGPPTPRRRKAAKPAKPAKPADDPVLDSGDEMGDDDYWATITFDKPKFPWQHDRDEERAEAELAADPLGAPVADRDDEPAAPPEQPPAPAEPASAMLTQPVSPGGADPAGYDGDGYGPNDYGPDGGQYGGEPGYGQEPGYGAEPGYGQEPGHYGEPAAAGGYGTGPQPSSPPPSPSFAGPPDSHDLPPVGTHFRGDGDPMGGPAGGDPAGPTLQDPYDFPSSQPAAASDALGLPVNRADDRSAGYGNPTETVAYGASESSYGPPADSSYGPPATETSYGAGDGSSSYGAPDTPSYGSDLPPAGSGPLHGGFGEQNRPRTDPGGFPDLGALPSLGGTPATPASSGSATRQGDTDGHRLPTVDELLQRIQSDRQRSAAGGTTTPGSGGTSLTDPLNDPLSTTHDPSYGSGGPWSPPASPGTAGAGGYEQPGRGHTDDLAGGQLSGGGVPGGFSGLGGGSAGYGSTGSGGSGSAGYSGESYPSAPAYGDTPRYDDPLSTPPSAGRDSYGTFGTGVGGVGDSSPLPGSPGSGGTGEPSRYGDFSGSSYPPGGDPNATQAMGGGYFGGTQPGYGPAAGSGETGAPHGEQPPSYPPQEPPRTTDDWESHRDYRR